MGKGVIVAHPWLALFSPAPRCFCSPGKPHATEYQRTQRGMASGVGRSVHALHTLEKMDRVGVVYSLRVIVELPKDSIAQTDAGWNALDRLSKRLASDPRCARVISITTIAEGDRASLTDLSPETRRTFLSSDGRAALAGGATRDFGFPARSSRLGAGAPKTGAATLTGVPGATLQIGGIPALNADYQTIVTDHFVPVMAMVVVATLLALLAGFRSLFAAVKAIALNLFSVAASFGALVLVFQDGRGSRLLGVPEARGTCSPLFLSSPLPSSSD